jgi:hypothetical protein
MILNAKDYIIACSTVITAIVLFEHGSHHQIIKNNRPACVVENGQKSLTFSLRFSRRPPNLINVFDR